MSLAWVTAARGIHGPPRCLPSIASAQSSLDRSVLGRTRLPQTDPCTRLGKAQRSESSRHTS